LIFIVKIIFLDKGTTTGDIRKLAGSAGVLPGVTVQTSGNGATGTINYVADTINFVSNSAFRSFKETFRDCGRISRNFLITGLKIM